VNNARLNLLRQQGFGRRHVRSMVRALAAGVCIGLVLLAVGEFWQARRARDVQARYVQLQADWQQAQARQAAQAQAHQQHQAMQGLLQRQRQWAQQRERLDRLQTAWEMRAHSQGWQVQRWQVDARGLTLQLWLPDVQAVPDLVQALSHVGPTAWSLQQLSSHSQGGVQALLQAAWPPARGPAVPKPSVQTEGGQS